ncbi:MAG: hypothetical protein UX13_C0005G0009 [Candidatus Woesebacteria bacterium GW2011_GWB1_45_5]|uniref:Glycosyltransferase RgtA/B/C/D-like domain-containing protein n=1 Tax=Candidatus Woesebacteria bacterium GW2011_GWB1_45_5 TaxID=1618581 RepID=A0A0G1MQT0_9BACT|nr:MAG: hypothetical protein UX13_C0005G0009 [Candidatus Woesebacteria bacterium GW2011_GWB1_45_5]
MKSVWIKLHKIGDALHLPDLPRWLCGLLALVLILRVPSFFEPYFYGDEMVYLTLGQGIRQGVPLYSGLHDNKPPLLYLAAAAAGSLFWFKVILAFWSVVTIVFFWKLARVLFKNNSPAQIVSTIIFSLLTTLPLLEGNIVNAELFMIGPSILAFYFLLGENLNPKKIFLSGLLFGISALFKVPALFEVPVIIFYWLIAKPSGSFRGIVKNSLLLITGFLMPVLLTAIWYFLAGTLSDYVKATFLQNIGYLSSFRPGDVQKSFLVRNAPLLGRGAAVLAGLAVVYISRKRLSNRFIFLCIWTLFVLFAITLSERPYPHYLIQVVAPVSFFLATFFMEKSLEQSLTVLPLTLTFLIPVLYKYYFYPTSSYYLHFVNFAAQKINRNEYFKGFSGTVVRNYEISNFLATSSKPGDKVFMWDPDSPIVYALSRKLPPIKYTVPYHVNDYSDRGTVADQLNSSLPKFIILTSRNPFPEIAPLLSDRYLLIQQIGNADIYSRIDFAEAK